MEVLGEKEKEEMIIHSFVTISSFHSYRVHIVLMYKHHI
jgi:hypothetical protein